MKCGFDDSLAPIANDELADELKILNEILANIRV